MLSLGAWRPVGAIELPVSEGSQNWHQFATSYWTPSGHNGLVVEQPAV